MTRQILLSLLTTSFFCGGILAAGPECMIQFNMENKDRYVYGEVTEECCCFPHTAPWGNWGVVSNVGNIVDGHQFQGIHLSDSKYQWNSCTQGDYEAPNSTYYNYPTSGESAWTEQWTYTGTNNYGGGYQYFSVTCPWYDDIDDEWYGGCRDRDGNYFGPYNNFMKLYELDPVGTDELVTTLYFNDNNVWAALDCPDWDYCPASTGAWVASNSNSIVSAEIRVSVVGGWYIDALECEEP